MSGFRLIILESSVRGETFFGKVNFKRADWSEPFFFVSTQNAPQTNYQEYGALALGISDEISRRVEVPKVMILQELSS